MARVSSYVETQMAASTRSEIPCDLGRLSDLQLVHLAKSGDPGSFSELTRRHRALVSSMIFRIVRHSEDTEDLLQEAFLKAFRHLDGFDERAKFSTWLTKIAINSSLMLLRKRKCQPTSLIAELGAEDDVVWAEIPSRGMNPEEQAAESEVFAQLRSAVSKLPAPLRIAMELRSERDLSVRDIARTMEISEAAAKSRLLRARSRVERAMRRSNRLPVQQADGHPIGRATVTSAL